MEATNQHWKAWLQLLLGLGLSLLFFYMMAPFLVAILLGAVLAIVSYPIYERLNVKLPNPLSAVTVTLGITLGILFPLIFLLYSGFYQLLKLFKNFRLPADSTIESLLSHPVISRALTAISKLIPGVDRDWLTEQSVQILQLIVERLTVLIAAFFAGIPSIILAFFIVILSTYFFFVDGGRFLRFLSSLSPLQHERSIQLYTAFETSCRGVVLGLFASSALQSTLMFISALLTGLPNPALLALLTFIMGMVPVIGSAPIWIGATLYLFFSGELLSAIGMLVGGICISGSDNIVRPLIMKEHSAMHPLVALVSVFGAVNLFGATGIFLGPIVAAVFISFLKIVAFEIRPPATAL